VIQIKLNTEHIIISLFSAIFIFLFASTVLNNQINHPSPYGYFASDAFQNYGIAKGIQESGNYKYQPLSVAGGFSDVVGTHYPILYHIVVLLSNTTGIEIHDSLILTMILFLLIACLSAYMIIKKHNTKVAIIALPFMLILLQSKFLNSIVYGQHGLIAGTMFLVGVIMAITYFGLEVSIVSIFLSATMLGHAGEFLFAGIFFVIYICIKFLQKEIKFLEIKKIILIGILTLVITSYYFVIVQYTWGKTGYSGLEFVSTEKFSEGGAFPPVLFDKDFSWIIIVLIVCGIIISIIGIIRKIDMTIIAFMFLILLGFSNYFGFGHRGFQQRFVWPIYISFFAAIAVYYGIKLILRNVNIVYTAIAFILLSGIFVFASSSKELPQGIMDQYHWDSFLWIQKNMEKDKSIFFFFQDSITQRSIYYASTQRRTYVIDLPMFIEKIQNRSISRYYYFDVSAEGGTGLPYRKSFFDFGYHTADAESLQYITGDFDICKMDYLVFDKMSARAKVIADYNNLLINELKKNQWIVEAYPDGISTNPIVVILKNNKPGEKCIEPKQFS